MKNYKNIIENGQYYKPCSKHYPNIDSPVVSCDRCSRIINSSCIGWKEYDLCLDCVNCINECDSNNDIKTFMMQNQFRQHKPHGNPSPTDPYSNYAPYENFEPSTQLQESQNPPEQEHKTFVTRMMPGQFVTKYNGN